MKIEIESLNINHQWETIFKNDFSNLKINSFDIEIDEDTIIIYTKQKEVSK